MFIENNQLTLKKVKSKIFLSKKDLFSDYFDSQIILKSVAFHTLCNLESNL